MLYKFANNNNTNRFCHLSNCLEASKSHTNNYIQKVIYEKS